MNQRAFKMATDPMLHRMPSGVCPSCVYSWVIWTRESHPGIMSRLGSGGKVGTPLFSDCWLGVSFSFLASARWCCPHVTYFTHTVISILTRKHSLIKCQPHLESSNGWEAHVQWRHDRCLSLVPTTTFTIPLLPNMVDLGEIVEEP